MVSVVFLADFIVANFYRYSRTLNLLQKLFIYKYVEYFAIL